MRTVLLSLVALFMTLPAFAGQSIQPGFYSHEPDGVDLSISAVQSGELCVGEPGPDRVCRITSKLTVTGRDNCVAEGREQKPCTRYGYRFNYAGATPGSEISCKVKQTDGYRDRSKNYALVLDSEMGSTSQSEWMPYGPVEQRLMVSEVHECWYQGELLATIEYIITYDPSTRPPVSSESAVPGATGVVKVDEIPHACGAMESDVGDDAELPWVSYNPTRPHRRDEHVADLVSQCWYTSKQTPVKEVAIYYKFVLLDLFDVDNLSEMQLKFHATFSGGGEEPVAILDEPGDITFVYRKDDRTTTFTVTDIQGPTDGAGRTRLLSATYHLEDPGKSHTQRLEVLLRTAEDTVAAWYTRFK